MRELKTKKIMKDGVPHIEVKNPGSGLMLARPDGTASFISDAEYLERFGKNPKLAELTDMVMEKAEPRGRA